MKTLCFTLATLTLLSTAFGETAPIKETKKAPGWSFELVPRAFQKNPSLDITVISELSEAGKKRPMVSTEAPVYYLAQPGGYRERGEPTHQKPLPAAEVEKILARALAKSGYFPATAEHSPSIAVIYTWGAHNVVEVADPENASDKIIRNILDRAALAGGDKFARDLAKAITDSQAPGRSQRSSARQQRRRRHYVGRSRRLRRNGGADRSRAPL